MPRLVAAVALVVVIAPGCARARLVGLPSATAIQPPAPAPASSTVAAAAGGEAAASLELNPEVAAVAGTYAEASLSYRFDSGPASWVEVVAPLCTLDWLARLRAETPVDAEWDGVVERREVARAEVLAVHASRSAGPGRRVVLVLRVEVSGMTPDHRVRVVELVMVPEGGRWLVAGS